MRGPLGEVCSRSVTRHMYLLARRRLAAVHFHSQNQRSVAYPARNPRPMLPPNLTDGDDVRASEHSSPSSFPTVRVRAPAQSFNRPRDSQKRHDALLSTNGANNLGAG